MTNTLLVEASLFGYDTFASVADYPDSPYLPKLPTGNAVERGWEAVPELLVPAADPNLPPVNLLESPGVDLADVGVLVGQPAGTFTSAAHFYTGELEGRQTLVITYRSTDEANEFGFQGLEIAPGVRGWDLYFGAHQAATEAALDYATLSQRCRTGADLRAQPRRHHRRAQRGPAGGRRARRQDPAGHPRLAGVDGGRRGRGATQRRPYRRLRGAAFRSQPAVHRRRRRSRGARPRGRSARGDAAPLPAEGPGHAGKAARGSEIPGIGAEHPSLLYIDTAALLASTEPYVPGVRDAEPGDMFRWLSTDLDRIIVGTDDAEAIRVGNGNGLVFARDGNDTVRGQQGDDVLMAMAGDNLLDGGPGNDVLVGGLGDDTLRGGPGDDLIYLFGGYDQVDGGAGTDTAVFAGNAADFDLTVVNREVVDVSGDGLEARLCKVELFRFDDQEFAFDGRELTPATSLMMASAVQDFLGLDGEIA